MRRLTNVGVAVVTMAALCAFAPARAKADPTGLAWTDGKNDGTIDGDTLYTGLNKPLSIDILGTVKDSALTVEIMGVMTLGTGKGKVGDTTLKLKDLDALADGAYAVVVIETVNMVASAPVGGAMLVVDRVSPGQPLNLEFGDDTENNAPSPGVITPMVPLELEGTAEADANVYVQVNGKLKAPKLKTAARDRAGVADGLGDFHALFEWEKARSFMLLGGDPDKPLRIKLKEGMNEIALVAMDRAGNVSPMGDPIAFDFISKAPKAARNIEPIGLDVRRVGSIFEVGAARPTFRGVGEPGLTANLLVDDVFAGAADIPDSGVFFVAPDTDLMAGMHLVTVEVINDALLPSKTTKPLTVDHIPGGVPLALPADSFDDNARDPLLWTLVEPTPADIMAVEANKRLTMQKPATNGGLVIAGYLGNGWALDLNSDFAISLRFSMPQDPINGDAGISIVFLDDADLNAGEVINGIAVTVGLDDVGGYFSMQRTVGGVDMEEFFEHDRNTSGPGVLEYDAATDTLFVGQRRNDPEAVPLGGLRSASPTELSTIFLGGFSEGDVPGVDGSQVWLDSFEVLEGEVVFGGLAPFVRGEPVEVAELLLHADVNGDGVVSMIDVHRVMQAFGAEGVDLTEDVDGDGKVTPEDLRLVLSRFGQREGAN